MHESALKSVRVPIDAILGSVDVTVEELSQMKKGTLIEFDRLAGEPVELRAGDNIMIFLKCLLPSLQISNRVM